jgi:V8-like Glu-specific endopeptidase
MPHPLESGTIRILKPDGTTAGTGFLVTKRLAVTCAHVIESAYSGRGKVIKFKYHLGDANIRTAKVLKRGWSEKNDVAVLELTEKMPKWIRPIIMQSSQAMEGRAFQSLGYPNDGPVQTRWPQGNISGRVEVEGYANPLLQVQGGEIDKGLSGSAVVDRTTRRVIGMITAYQDVSRPRAAENVRFGYAVPIETVWKVYPDLEKELPPLPKRSPLVEGIHLLPSGYDFRIQNFLNEYLGTPEQPKPFGGREDALGELDEWLEGDTQRLLLAAPAGRGKSALLVRWLDRLLTREDLRLIFIPVSVRFRMNLAGAFFASLAARLAHLHGEDVTAVESTSTDAWHALSNLYLSKPLDDEKKLLVVLDGLDEAGDWEATADLIPTELPRNVRVVVSARFLAGDVDAGPWLSRLGWERTGRASTLELHPLDTSGVADVLFRMGVPLGKLGHQANVVSELHRLSNGDPLLVNLYVEDLWARGEDASRLKPADLRDIRPGYEGYFDRWWNEQKKLWGKEAPLREKSVQLVFNFLCGAMGRLTSSDLIALDKQHTLNTYVIEDALDVLKRFVIGISDEHGERDVGYILTHPKLRNYFWERLTEKERASIESRFVDWGGRVMRGLLAGRLQPVDVPRYLSQYYVSHLEQSHASAREFLPFIEYSYWHQAAFHLFGTYDGYLQDVGKAWKIFNQSDKDEVCRTGKASFMTKQLRCMCIESSLRNLPKSIPIELLIQLFTEKLWTPARIMLHLRESIRNHYPEALKIHRIAGMLPGIYLRDLLIELGKHKDDEDRKYRMGIFEDLALYLPENPDIQAAIVKGKFRRPPDRGVEYESTLTDLERKRLVSLIEKVKSLPQKLPGRETIQAVKLSVVGMSRTELVHGLCAILRFLPERLQAPVLQCAVDLAQNVFFGRTQLLVEVIQCAPEKLRAIPCSTALQLMKSEESFKYTRESRFKFMEDCTPYLSKSQAEKILNILSAESDWQAMAVILKLGSYWPQVKRKGVWKKAFRHTLSELNAAKYFGHRLIPEVLPHVNDKERDRYILNELEMIEKNDKQAEKVEAVQGIAPYLYRQHLEKALEILRRINDTAESINALIALSPYIKKERLFETLEYINGIENEHSRQKVFENFVPFLTSGFSKEIVHALRQFKSDYTRPYAIKAAAPMLSDRAILQVVKLIREMEDDYMFIEGVAGAAPYLPEKIKQRLLMQALKKARSLKDDYEMDDYEGQSRALGKIAPFLPEELQRGVFFDAIAMASRIWDEDDRTVTISSFAKAMPWDIRKSAEYLVREFWDPPDFPEEDIFSGRKPLSLQAEELYDVLSETIYGLSKTPRSELYNKFKFLVPPIRKISNEQVFDEIYKIIRGVTTWWP